MRVWLPDHLSRPASAEEGCTYPVLMFSTWPQVKERAKNRT